jgi:putative ABC transport system substrate-binding protein
MGGKWLELLKEIAPTVKRAGIMFNPDTAPYGKSYFLPSFEAAAQSLKVEPIVAPATPRSKRSSTHRAPIILAAARNNLPAVYFQSIFAEDGGLLSYGPTK